jgi:hypothetical protein
MSFEFGAFLEKLRLHSFFISMDIIHNDAIL